MFVKNTAEASGGYVDRYCDEDYYLWRKMIENGCVFENVPEAIVNVRVGKDMSSHRGGWKYFKSKAKLQMYMLHR